MMEKTLNNKIFYILILMIIVFSIIVNGWVVSNKNGFVFDDISHIKTVKFLSYSQIFNTLPQSKYNDRPMGVMFLKLLFENFGMNHNMHHLILLVLHIFNTLLLLVLCLKLFKDDNYKYYAILVASIFSIYPKALMAVQWDAAIFDLFGATLVLISLIFYLNLNTKYTHFYGCFWIIFYFLSLRTKEMSLGLPIIALIYEIYISLKTKKRINISPYLIFAAVIMFLYTFLLFSLNSAGNITKTIDNPYFQSFNPIRMVSNFFKYLLLYFNPFKSGFSFDGVAITDYIGILIIIIVFISAIYIIFKNYDNSLGLSILSLAVILAPVLPMVNMQHILYLYIPSIFISIILVICFKKFVNKFNFKYLWEFTFVFIPLLYIISYFPGIVNFRNSWSSYVNIDRKGMEIVSNMNPPTQESNVYITGTDSEYTYLFYGPGAVLNVAFNDASIKTHLVKEFPNNPITPYVFWQYKNSKLLEVKRESEIKINILNVYVSPNKNHEGGIDIGVTCDRISSDCVITANGEELKTIFSPEFISATIPQALQKKSNIIIAVLNKKYNIKSPDKVIELK